MIRCNFHTHTLYCDGKNTVEQLAQAAAEQNMRALGFSGHGRTEFDLSYCMTDTAHYIQDVMAAKAKYAGRLEIYLGVEDDIYGARPDFSRDYTIGSVHYVRHDGRYWAVDDTPELLHKAIREAFHGDPLALTKRYFETVAQVRTVTGCDFVGHFDLISKYNRGLFDEEDPRYLGPALEALEHLCKQDSVFEINTGAMVRAGRTVPYPAPPLLRAIHDFGGSIVLSSDCHDARYLLVNFGLAASLALECGFRTARILTPNGWQEDALQ